MIPEASLVAVLIILFVADFISAKTEERKWFNPLACALLLANTIVCLLPMQPEEAFGGMYITSAAVNVMKAILAFGTFIVVLQSRVWAGKSGKEGEFYMLVVSTLLGMNTMMSAGNFLMFFLGLEMASVPMACVVAFDAYRNNSAEAAAKFILTATFSSGVMLYGISFIYAAYGTMYFNDIAANIQATPLTIMGLVFFFSGLGFKISLVPFHFWTADTYQGAPTTVTGYLSVISKGAAAFTLLSILFHVFDSLLARTYDDCHCTFHHHCQPLRYPPRRVETLHGVQFYLAGRLHHACCIGQQLGRINSIAKLLRTYLRGCQYGCVHHHLGCRTEQWRQDRHFRLQWFLQNQSTFSLGGIPPFAGMFSKFFVFMSGVKGADITTTEGAWIYGILFIALINTVVSLYYYLKIVKAMYITHCDTPMPTFKSDTNTKFALAVCTTGIVLFGVFSYVYEWIAAAI